MNKLLKCKKCSKMIITQLEIKQIYNIEDDDAPYHSCGKGPFCIDHFHDHIWNCD